MESILIVEDNKDMQFLLSNILREEGYKIISVGNGARAIQESKKKEPDLVLLDMKLPGMHGMEVFEELRKINKEILVIMITAYGDVKDAVRAMKLGAYDYITKPFDNDDLILTIKKALKTHSLSKEVEKLKNQLRTDRIIVNELGQSPTIIKVLKQIDLIAPTNMSVIIQGKSGTGKEVVANIIHQRSDRKEKPFIAVDCGAIPDTLVESELFGYERGAFTGANNTKKGKFEEANEGTLLLDEITNLPLEGQVKLLRALEERTIYHIGGKKPINIDVRVITTSNLVFEEEIANGNFREDLFHRINEFEINLPLLKERKEDIPILAREFLKEANDELGKSIKNFSADAMKLLLEYSWPGNIRELKHKIRRATLLSESEYITPVDISIKEDAENENSILLSEIAKGATFDNVIRNVEKELILKAIEKMGGNKSKAATLLNINRKTLYRKMKYLGLPL